MNKLLVCICFGTFSSAAMADVSANQWLERLDDRGVEIELIRVASEKPLVDVKEDDADVDNILKEAAALENDASASDSSEDPS